MPNKLIIIGGASGSGKSTLAKYLAEELGADIVSGDRFYKSKPDDVDAADYNFDSPNALDYDLMIKFIKKYLDAPVGEVMFPPVYDFHTHKRIDESIMIVKPILILEGILLLNNKELRDLADWKIFVHTDLDECLARRIERDIAERGRDVKGVLLQWRKFVKPACEEFIEPHMTDADTIVPNKHSITEMIEHDLVKDLLTLVKKHISKGRRM